jgi:succinate dehydrogenase flavin-adding protein (antitoxin of CptAB toxin-antitoxin module)
MDSREMLIDYQGEINYAIISKIISELKRKIDKKKESVTIFKHLLTITDESLENISMYFEKNIADSDTLHKYPSLFQLYSNTNSYWITARNPIKITDKTELIQRIDTINAYTEIEIKKLYKETIRNGKLSDQGGAGLGLLIIAKSSCKKINYTFEQINKELSYFSLIIEIIK